MGLDVVGLFLAMIYIALNKHLTGDLKKITKYIHRTKSGKAINSERLVIQNWGLNTKMY